MDDHEIDELLQWAGATASTDSGRPRIIEIQTKVAEIQSKASELGALCRSTRDALKIDDGLDPPAADPECPTASSECQAADSEGPDPYAAVLGPAGPQLLELMGMVDADAGWLGRIIAEACGEADYPSWRTRKVLDELEVLWGLEPDSRLERLAQLGGNSTVDRAPWKLLSVFARQVSAGTDEAEGGGGGEGEGEGASSGEDEGTSSTPTASDDETDEETAQREDAVAELEALRGMAWDAKNAIDCDYTSAPWLNDEIADVLSAIKSSTPGAVWQAVDDGDEDDPPSDPEELAIATTETRQLLDRLEAANDEISAQYDEAVLARDRLLRLGDDVLRAVTSEAPAKRPRESSQGETDMDDDGTESEPSAKRQRVSALESAFQSMFDEADVVDDDSLPLPEELPEPTSRAWALLEAELIEDRGAEAGRAELEDWRQFEALVSEQQRADLVIPTPAFAALCDEVLSELDWRSGELAIDQTAYAALQTAAEDFLIKTFDQAGRRAIRRGRTLLESEDFEAGQP